MKLTKTNRRKRSQAGLTLTEVLVSIVLTGVATVGMINGHVFASQQSARSLATAEVQMEMDSRLAETKAARWDILAFPVMDQLVSENFPSRVVEMDSRAAGEAQSMIESRVSIATISSDPPLKKVEIECVWTAKSGDLRTNIVTTLRSPDQ